MADAGVPPNGVFVDQFNNQVVVAQTDPAKAADSTEFKFQLTRITNRLATSIKADKVGITEGTQSDMVMFLQDSMDRLLGRPKEKNSGVADKELLADINTFLASRASQGEAASPVQGIKNLKDLSGRELSEIIIARNTSTGGARISSNAHEDIEGLVKAVRALKLNDGSKNPEDRDPLLKIVDRIERDYLPKRLGETTVPGTDGKVAYDASGNVLTYNLPGLG